MSAPAPFTPAVLAVAHPEWCTSGECDLIPDSDGSTLAVHRTTVAAEPCRVQVRQGVTVEPDGQLDRHDVEVIVDGEALSLPDVRRLVAALVLAAELAAGGAR